MKLGIKIVLVVVALVVLELTYELGAHLERAEIENAVDTTYVSHKFNGLALAIQDTAGGEYRRSGVLPVAETVVIEWPGRCLIIAPQPDTEEGE